MIQRIQTIFLLGAMAAILGLFYLDIAVLNSKEVTLFNLNGYHLFNTSVADSNSQIWLKVAGYGLALLILITIFLFKNRKLQMKLCFINIILALGLNGLIYYLPRHHYIISTDISYQYPVLFPIVAVILLFMAYRAILKDHRLIKSLDRLR
jgi:hypothetical protein